MTKPILILKGNFDGQSDEDIKKSVENLKKTLKNEYHVLLINEKCEKVSIEVLNDCKGLTDVDIEKLINSIR